MEPFPLFNGATRPPTLLGVPLVPIMLMFMVVACIAMLTKPWWIALAIPAWAVMAAITRHDDRAFRVWGLALDTKLRNRNKRFWKASSYAPAPPTKR